MQSWCHSGSPLHLHRTSKVRISCRVRSLDAAHLVLRESRLEMEMSTRSWMSRHRRRASSAPAGSDALPRAEPSPPSIPPHRRRFCHEQRPEDVSRATVSASSEHRMLRQVSVFVLQLLQVSSTKLTR